MDSQLKSGLYSMAIVMIIVGFVASTQKFAKPLLSNLPKTIDSTRYQNDVAYRDSVLAAHTPPVFNKYRASIEKSFKHLIENNDEQALNTLKNRFAPEATLTLWYRDKKNAPMNVTDGLEIWQGYPQNVQKINIKQVTLFRKSDGRTIKLAGATVQVIENGRLKPLKKNDSPIAIEKFLIQSIEIQPIYGDPKNK